MSFVGMAFPLSCARKRLTRTGAGPDFAIFGPAGKGEGERPATESSEEVDVLTSKNIVGSEARDAALVNGSGGKMPGRNEASEPLRRERVDLIIKHPLALRRNHC
jgi:hypothetical protein